MQLLFLLIQGLLFALTPYCLYSIYQIYAFLAGKTLIAPVTFNVAAAYLFAVVMTGLLEERWNKNKYVK